MLLKNYEMSADASDYDLQDVECQRLLPSCEISSRLPKFAKWAVTNLSEVLRSFCLPLSAPVCLWLQASSQLFQIARFANFPTLLSIC